MRKSVLAPIVLVVLALVVLPACKKIADLAKYKDTAMALVAQYGPQLKGLAGQLEGLSGKAKLIPAGVPGADALNKLIDGNKDKLAKLQGLLGKLPDDTAAAIKTGKKDQVEKLLADATTSLSTGAAAISADVGTATTTLAELEAKAAATPPADPTAPPAAADFTKKLSSGFELKGAATGIESQVVAFIEDATRPVDKTTWFNFDRLTFQAGGGELDLDKSKDQLANVVEILKAFPAVTLKIGGYTDNTGKADANQKLSQLRAETVVKALVAAGIDGKRLTAEGYGSAHPVCTEDTDECRGKNRRISVRVDAK